VPAPGYALSARVHQVSCPALGNLIVGRLTHRSSCKKAQVGRSENRNSDFNSCYQARSQSYDGGTVDTFGLN